MVTVRFLIVLPRCCLLTYCAMWNMISGWKPKMVSDSTNSHFHLLVNGTQFVTVSDGIPYIPL